MHNTYQGHDHSCTPPRRCREPCRYPVRCPFDAGRGPARIHRRHRTLRRPLDARYGHFDDRDTLIRELISSGAQRFNVIAASNDDDVRLALARLVARLWQEAAHVQVAAALALARLIEEMARTVISQTNAASTGAADLAVRAVLSIAGLS